MQDRAVALIERAHHSVDALFMSYSSAGGKSIDAAMDNVRSTNMVRCRQELAQLVLEALKEPNLAGDAAAQACLSDCCGAVEVLMAPVALPMDVEKKHAASVVALLVTLEQVASVAGSIPVSPAVPSPLAKAVLAVAQAAHAAVEYSWMLLHAGTDAEECGLLVQATVASKELLETLASAASGLGPQGQAVAAPLRGCAARLASPTAGAPQALLYTLQSLLSTKTPAALSALHACLGKVYALPTPPSRYARSRGPAGASRPPASINRVYLDMGQPGVALNMFAKAHQASMDADTRDGTAEAGAGEAALLLGQARCLCEVGRFRDAIAVYGKALRSVPAGDSLLKARVLSGKGFAALRASQAKDAAAAYQALLDLSQGNGHMICESLALQGLALASIQAGSPADAVPLLSTRLDLLDKAHGPGSPDAIVCLLSLALALAAQGQPDEARRLSLRATTASSKAPELSALCALVQSHVQLARGASASALALAAQAVGQAKRQSPAGLPYATLRRACVGASSFAGLGSVEGLRSAVSACAEAQDPAAVVSSLGQLCLMLLAPRASGQELSAAAIRTCISADDVAEAAVLQAHMSGMVRQGGMGPYYRGLASLCELHLLCLREGKIESAQIPKLDVAGAPALLRPLLLATLAEAYAKAGRPKRAKDLSAEAIEAAATGGQHGDLACIHLAKARKAQTKGRTQKYLQHLKSANGLFLEAGCAVAEVVTSNRYSSGAIHTMRWEEASEELGAMVLTDPGALQTLGSSHEALSQRCFVSRKPVLLEACQALLRQSDHTSALLHCDFARAPGLAWTVASKVTRNYGIMTRPLLAQHALTSNTNFVVYSVPGTTPQCLPLLPCNAIPLSSDMPGNAPAVCVYPSAGAGYNSGKIHAWVALSTGEVEFLPLPHAGHALRHALAVLADCDPSVCAQDRDQEAHGTEEATIAAQQDAFRQLYTLLIDPLAGLLPIDECPNLCFIPDGILRIITPSHSECAQAVGAELGSLPSLTPALPATLLSSARYSGCIHIEYPSSWDSVWVHEEADGASYHIDAAEIAQKDFRASVVFLSDASPRGGCPGVAKPRHDDDTNVSDPPSHDIHEDCLFGMEYAFHSAGVPAVVSSLWRVPDSDVKTAFAASFYSYLKKQLRPAAALQAACSQTCKDYPAY
eukprot:gene5548-993_t